jgi:hypothetical protein
VLLPAGPPDGDIGGFSSGVETFGCIGGACDSGAEVLGATDVERVDTV